MIVERDDGKGLIRLTASKQLGHFFNAYAQKFNVRHNRTGSLFESPFRRKLITNQTQLKEVIRYINRNAQHHGFVKDFEDWPYSSYHSILTKEPMFLSKKWMVDLFGGKKSFIEFHLKK